MVAVSDAGSGTTDHALKLLGTGNVPISSDQYRVLIDDCSVSFIHNYIFTVVIITGVRGRNITEKLNIFLV